MITWGRFCTKNTGIYQLEISKLPQYYKIGHNLKINTKTEISNLKIQFKMHKFGFENITNSKTWDLEILNQKGSNTVFHSRERPVSSMRRIKNLGWIVSHGT